MNTNIKPYENIKILLATKHQKERAIAQPFHDVLHATIHTPSDYDTDIFGTFTGEIDRKGTPYEVVIAKAKRAMEQYGFDYAIASEGSFGPHPSLFFVPADIELMSFIDNQNNLLVVESEITTETNFAHIDLSQGENYDAFLAKARFGTHGLIVKDIANNKIIAKGVTERESLDEIIKASHKTTNFIRLETDMRAMMNPTRMNVIHRLALKLCSRLQNRCPGCESPGFGKTTVTGHLPCEDCANETPLYQSKMLHCVKCSYHEIQARDDGAVKAEAKYCSYCNP